MAEKVKSEAKIKIDDDRERLEKIHRRAYELYEASGREEGRDIDNWLQAEAEIEASQAQKAKI